MKIAAYYKNRGDDVTLKLDYDNLHRYDIVSISKVFIDTEIPYEHCLSFEKNEETVAEFYKDHPISSLYTYSNSDRDMGNCKNDEEFYL